MTLHAFHCYAEVTFLPALNGVCFMEQVTQFSVFLINKPGMLAQVIEAIAKAHINIVALTIVDSQEHGVLRIVANNPRKLAALLETLNVMVHTTRVISVELPNRTGALAQLVSKLAEAHVNIDYAYVTSGAPGGKTIGIVKVDQPVKAMKMLKPKTTKKAKRTTVKSRGSARRR